MPPASRPAPDGGRRAGAGAAVALVARGLRGVAAVRHLPSGLRALLGPTAAGARQSLVALVVGLFASLVAGITLASVTDTLDELPGLLVLVPAAIGLRGTIFGALGSRLGTAIHAGTFRITARPDTVLGQNVLAASVLTVVASVVLGVVAKGAAVGFGVEGSIGLGHLVAISLVGGVLASLVVLVLTVVLAAGSVRFGWDLDNVTAPVVTAAGDMVTLPALVIAVGLVDNGFVRDGVVVAGVVIAVGVLVSAYRSALPELRGILTESIPVVLLGGTLSLVAGVTLERRLDTLTTYPALLALVPAFLASAGALGGILSSRLASKLHLGVIEPAAFPPRGARGDIAVTYLLALPAFALASVVADVASVVTDLESPGALTMVVVALVGGLLATTFAVFVAYEGSVASYRMGLDPDTTGIPLVTSTIDLVGSLCFIVAVVVAGAT